uniref:Zinc finger protein 692 n=1 Tax=Scleropages formosus TaxID=113540 RepID=A0A8D0CLG1_SCLFO
MAVHPASVVMSSSRDALRRQRRRELDARRSKSRVRLGACLQSWGQLKESLGFVLHSELAQFLLERHGNTNTTGLAGSCSLVGLGFESCLGCLAAD